MARLLSVADYGVLVSIMAIYTLIAVPSEAVQNTITRYVTLNPEPGKIKDIMRKSFKRFSRLSLAAFILFIILAIPLSKYLNIGYFALAVSGFVIFVTFFNPIPRAVLLGEKKYSSLGLNVILEGVLKIVLGVGFVFLFSSLGYFYLKVHGAVLGVVVGALIALFVAFVPLKNISSAVEQKANVKDIYFYVKPAFIVTLVIFAFISVDVILAKIIFDPETAGSYAIASTLGKIIFFVTGPIAKAMFPLTSSESNQSVKSRKILIYSGIFLFAMILFGLLIYYFFPTLLVLLFSGKSLPAAESILFIIAIGSALVAISNLLLTYRLSIGKTKGSIYFGSFIVIEILLLCFYSQTIMQFSFAFLAAAIIFLIGTLVIFKYE
jgi:O-antigen/teichoic acid export membrane protein